MIMPIEEAQQSQRPYRYGMVLLCVGALINWLHLADVEPVRYIGIVCIVAGAVLIGVAICLWLQAPSDLNTADAENSSDGDVHVIDIDGSCSRQYDQKPPDYDTVANEPPPSYDAAIKLDPARLLPCVIPTPIQFLNTPLPTPRSSFTRSPPTRSLSSPGTAPEVFKPETSRSISSPETVIVPSNSTNERCSNQTRQSQSSTTSRTSKTKSSPRASKEQTTSGTVRELLSPGSSRAFTNRRYPSPSFGKTNDPPV